MSVGGVTVLDYKAGDVTLVRGEATRGRCGGAGERRSGGQVMMMTWGLTCPDFIFRLHHQFNSVWWSRKKPTQQLFIVDIFFSDLKRKTLIISTHSWWLETKLEEWCDQESEQLEEAPGPRLLAPPHLRSLCDQWCVKSELSQGVMSSIINIERSVKECIVCVSRR